MHWGRLERCLNSAHTPFSQPEPKGLESACTTARVQDYWKHRNSYTQGAQELSVSSADIICLQATTLVGSQKLIRAWKEVKKEWEVSYCLLSFSGDTSWVVQIKLKLCCCQLVLPSFDLLICIPTDYPVFWQWSCVVSWSYLSI